MCGVVAGQGCTFINDFYLNGVPGTTGLSPRGNEKLFYTPSNAETLGLTKEDDGILLTEDVIAQLNGYIETSGYAETEEDKVDTTGWCKWVMGPDEVPILDFNTEWNGTAWVTVTD